VVVAWVVACSCRPFSNRGRRGYRTSCVHHTGHDLTSIRCLHWEVVNAAAVVAYVVDRRQHARRRACSYIFFNRNIVNIRGVAVK
jgi:hypothetical protein